MNECNHICKCRCHIEPILHFMPCCYKCDLCGLMINTHYFNEHEKDCHNQKDSDGN